MSADPVRASSISLLSDREVDGLVLAPIGRSPWRALRALRRAMAELQRANLEPRLTWVLAISHQGRIVPGRAPDAAVFVMGYRLAGVGGGSEAAALTAG
jgi:hypothetical protein